jgi:hypothetical protein
LAGLPHEGELLVVLGFSDQKLFVILPGPPKWHILAEKRVCGAIMQAFAPSSATCGQYEKPKTKKFTAKFFMGTTNDLLAFTFGTFLHMVIVVICAKFYFHWLRDFRFFFRVGVEGIP